MIYTPNGKATKLYAPSSGLSKLVQLGYAQLGKFWPEEIIDITPAEAISAGGYSTFIIKDSGRAYSAGYNGYGNLCTDKQNGSSTVSNLSADLTDVKYVAVGPSHTMIIKIDNTLWSSGLNNYGQLGAAKPTGNLITPNLTQVLTDVLDVSNGDEHSLIVKTDNTLWTCGKNTNGQLLGTQSNGSTSKVNLTQVMTGVKAVAAGNRHSLIVKIDGTLWTGGYNQYGQLGRAVSNGSSISPNLAQITNNVRSVSAGTDFSLFVKTDDTLWTCGNNSYGQLGASKASGAISSSNLTMIATGVQDAAAGNTHSLILKTDGTLWTCGQNNFGQLAAVKNSGSSTSPNLTQVLTGVKAIAAGNNFSMIIKTDNTVWSCGYNHLGQLAAVRDNGSTLSSNLAQVVI